MHTLNLRLSPDELGWIAADAEDRFIVVDDILLPQFGVKETSAKIENAQAVSGVAAVRRSSSAGGQPVPTLQRRSSP